MAYTIRQNGAQLQVYNAMTGAPIFTIGGIGPIHSWSISGETVTIYSPNGTAQVWDLSRRTRLR